MELPGSYTCCTNGLREPFALRATTALMSARRDLRREALWLAAFVTFGCGGDREVPFGQGGGGEPAVPTHNDVELLDFSPSQSDVLEAGRREVTIEGAPIASPGRELRAVLATDLDGDGDRDALVVLAGDSSVGLAVARREGTNFTVSDLGRPFRPGDGCQVEGARIATLSRVLAEASATLTCEAGAAEVRWQLTVERQPRLRERVGVLAGAPLSVRLEARAVDDDEHPDLAATVTVRPPGLAPVELGLTWLDRPSGLAREQGEPEATISRLATEARSQLARDTDAARETADRALFVHRTLCREGAPGLVVGESRGLACGASGGAASAATIRVAALARGGELFSALDAMRALRDGPHRASAADRSVADEAFAAAGRSEGLGLRDAGAVPADDGRAERHGTLGFLPTGHLLIRGAAPRRWDPSTGESESLGVLDEALAPVRDRDGGRAVLDVRRTCAGYVAAVVPAGQVQRGATFALSTDITLETLAPPTGTACDSPSARFTNDDGGWMVLGWAPQGLIAGRGPDLRIAPLTADGQAAGPPRDLDVSSPLPAPIHGGAISPDGSVYVLPSAYGVLLRRLGPEARTELLRPDGWDDTDASIAALAVSPDGHQVAVLRGARVVVIDGL